MANIIDYINHTHESFIEKPFGMLDAFVCSLCSYFLFENTPASQSSRAVLLAQALGTLSPECLSNLFWFDEWAPRFRDALLANPRYASLRVSDAVSVLNTHDYGQFAACCLHVPDGSLFLSFRGTDNTITGWEENLAMAVLEKTAAQTEAGKWAWNTVRHWCRAAEQGNWQPFLPIVRLGGHSKGGNLALYAGLSMSGGYSDQLVRLYNFDGPGLTPSFMEEVKQRPDKRALLECCTKVVPSYSVFGMLFNSEAVPLVVRSTERGVMQHMPFSWVVAGDEFEWSRGEHPLTRINDRAFNTWLANLSLEDRMTFLSVLFGIMEYASPHNSVEELASGLWHNTPGTIRMLHDLDKPMRDSIQEVLTSLIADFVASTQDIVRESIRSGMNHHKK